ncbi:MAG: TolC family protein [Myxococcales bacterium]|nr:TolC family protein [Myxococcales bacterium]
MLGLLAASAAASPIAIPKPLGKRLDKSITLAEAMQIAARRNLEVLSNDLERRRVSYGYKAEMAAFLPELSLSGTYRKDPTRPTIQTLNNTPTRIDVPGVQRLYYGGAVGWKSPIGSELSVGLNFAQSLTTGLNHDSELAVSAKQPLLRSAWLSGASNKLREAKLDIGIQRALFRQQLNDLLVKVENAYWTLAFAQIDVRNRMRTRDRAKQQFKDTQENIRRGILAKPEILVVEENLVFFEQQLVTAKQSLALARRELSALLIVAGDSKITATDDLGKLPASIPARDKAVRQGLDHNATLRAELLRVSKNRVTLAFEKNQTLPALDLVATFKLNGIDPAYGRHLGEIFAADRPEGTIGLTFKLPLSWMANRARVSRAKLTLQKQLVALKQQEAKVRYEIGDVVTKLAFQRKRLKLSERLRALSKGKLDFEVKKYKNGLSTLAFIVRFQREYDQAILAVRRAQLEVRQTRAQLYGLYGTLHRTYGITIGGRTRGGGGQG